MSVSSANEAINKYRIIPAKCISCTKCRLACPSGCISNSKPRIIDQSMCRHCGTCYNICPVNAVEMA